MLCLASDREQAQIFANTGRLLQREPAPARDGRARDRDELDLKSGVSIVVGTANYRAVRGRTVVCAVLDEVGVWKSETTMAPDIENLFGIDAAWRAFPDQC